MLTHAPYTITDETERAYQYHLDELHPLDGWDGTPFSLLLRDGDPIAYQVGLTDYRDQTGGEAE